MSRVLEDILVRYELPYQVIGGTKFYERAEIKDAVAYLQLLVNPADAVSFSRVINSPRRGIGDTSQARMLAHANTTGPDDLGGRVGARGVPGLGAAAIKSVGRFTELIEGLREDFEDAPVAELLQALLERSGYFDTLQGRANDRGRGPDREPRGARRRRRRVRRQPRDRGRLGPEPRSTSSCRRSRSTPTRTTSTRASRR